MKFIKTKTISIFGIKTLLVLFLLSSCEIFKEENPLIVKDKNTHQTTFYGPAKSLGNGKAQSFITLNKGGKPVAFGVAMSEKSLENLPSGQGGHEGHHSFEYLLELPTKANILPFKFVTLDWNPMGHEPEGVYDLPHFDFHFYLISDEERLTITPLAPNIMDPEIPMAKYIPTGYIQLPGRVPNMGVHWIDPTAPELNGEIFKKNFTYGTFKEKLAFMEPMISLDYIKSKPTVPADVIPLPGAFQVYGYYPSKYEVKYNTQRKEYLILMSEFTFKMADTE
ncbi:DUF5602 domain-containing protein [Aquiflexum sp.]|uniref:DUF5602 domain-containing protein n=1 Tax=Aquiflexum sp. TaxID=1872584 RepID=UPI0035940FD3